MFDAVDTRNPHEVEAQVRSIHHSLFLRAEHSRVARAFRWVTECFLGSCPGYQAIDAPYHDFEHTLQVTLCLAHLLQARDRTNALPHLTEDAFHLALISILFHDTGYLKKSGDMEGTGAKYTRVHVERGVDFTREFLSRQRFPAGDTEAILGMIRCTGVNADLDAIPFRNDLERLMGCAVATADLLGQMAVPGYVERLPLLYEEFAEAARHEGRAEGRLVAFQSAGELIRNTPVFWEHHALPRLARDFRSLYLCFNDPQPDGPNEWVQRVEHHLKQIAAAENLQP